MFAAMHASAPPASILRALKELALQYPADMRDSQLMDIPRIAFHLSIVSASVPPNGTVCDIGGGIGLFSIGCAALGYRTILVDDFEDPVNHRLGQEAFAVHRRLGVTIISRDAVVESLDLPPASVDAVTSFDSMEHWHHSPKRLFDEVKTCLRPGGLFVLGVPNCVNMRKRLTVPLGIGKWSSFDDWYHSPRFRGHVREADVDDLRRIGRDIGLRNPRIVGRNWLAYNSRFGWVRRFAGIVDRPLRLRPSLCADLYLIGTR